MNSTAEDSPNDRARDCVARERGAIEALREVMAAGSRPADRSRIAVTNVVGYARVSTREQNPASQEAALVRAGAGRVFTDRGDWCAYFSGRLSSLALASISGSLRNRRIPGRVNATSISRNMMAQIIASARMAPTITAIVWRVSAEFIGRPPWL